MSQKIEIKQQLSDNHLDETEDNFHLLEDSTNGENQDIKRIILQPNNCTYEESASELEEDTSNQQENLTCADDNKKTVKRKLDSTDKTDSLEKKKKTVKRKRNPITSEDPLDVGEMTSKKVIRNKSFKYFQQEWFDEYPSWKDWVVRLTNDAKFYCKYCDKTMLCGKKEIRNHETTKKHQKKKELTEKLIRYGYVLNNVVNVPVLFSTNNPAPSNSENVSTEPKSLPFKQKVKDAEDKITRFFLENNIPFMLSPKVIGLFREIEPLVLKDVRLSSSKMSILAKEICALKTGQEKIVFPKTRKKDPLIIK